jgi:hypothetical protein
MTLSRKHRAFIDEYFKTGANRFNATAAYQAVYHSNSYEAAGANASRLLKNDKVSEEIERRMSELQASADEALIVVSEQMRARLSDFYKIVEEWTFYPLPTYDIIDQKEVEVLDGEGSPTGEKKISYWVRHVAIDPYKLVDPQYSHLLKSFADTDKGQKIEIADKLAAADKILRVNNKYRDTLDVNIRSYSVDLDDGND